ncbi:branched-chain amino acid ABC transporter permease [Pusillimonas sp.]|uniref:branched-chain amino acid ABC transporter permease n=1 Tax=Pusillimonas sp. TaxID=3040095 RepID=UPI0029A5B8A4|nr:branched-chain amino acid ABC transporter permease [Pusillimonas sp.]MDX3893860.1 branched-chain amino acid ABC transporter permease [Pusillimonas sp.]
MSTSTRNFLYPLTGLACAAAVAFFAPGVLSPFDLRILNLGLLAGIAAVGLVVSFGYTGLINIGQSAFMCIGAYISAVLTLRFGLSPVLTVPVSVAAGILAAAAIGLPLLRLRGHYLALGTLGLVVTIEVIVKNWTGVTGGYDGLSGIRPLEAFGVDFAEDENFIFIVAGLLYLFVLFGMALRHSRFGRAMIIVRDDELSAAACGVNVFRTKMLAFAISGGCGALSGALTAHYSLYIAPSDFDLVRALMVLTMVILGGEMSFFGAFLGAVFLTFLPEWLRFVGSAYIAVFSVLLILVLVFLPNGLFQGLGNFLRGLLRRSKVSR